MFIYGYSLVIWNLLIGCDDLDFISSIFNPIVQLLEFILGIFHDFLSTVGLESYGVAIIVLTIIIKMAFYPLTVKQVKSMKAMQELQPKMKKLQDKFKNDPKRLQQEMGLLLPARVVR